MRARFIKMSASAILVFMNAAWVAGQSAPGLPGAPSQAPIDGGLSILAAAGVGYAMYKLKNRHKE